jgi:hypothetical protein
VALGDIAGESPARQRSPRPGESFLGAPSRLDFGEYLVLRDGKHAYLLSIPSIPNCCTKPSADWANRSRLEGSEATAANGSLPLPPPPTESTTLSFVYFFFNNANEFRHPWVPGTSSAPDTSIWASAHSSLSYTRVTRCSGSGL